jgi:hypothetical protein
LHRLSLALQGIDLALPLHKFIKFDFSKFLFSFWCNFKAKGDIILHFGMDKTIQGSFSSKKQKHILLALNHTVILRAKFQPKITQIRQNSTCWQACDVVPSMMMSSAITQHQHRWPFISRCCPPSNPACPLKSTCE